MSKKLQEMTLREQADVIWGDPFKNGDYVQEASTLDANSKIFPRNVCPKCLGKFNMKNHFVRHECSPGNEKEMGEILAWHFRHICGAKIVIFND